MVSRWSTSRPGGALAGMRVVDLAQQLPGPYATFLLAELGASVIKIEPPGGDVARIVDPPMYEQLNAHKRVIELDLKTAEGRAELHALVAEADAVLEAWRPGVADRIGAGPAELAQLNPALIYCSISGYGPEGPLASRVAHDLNIQALVGALDGQEPSSGRIGVAWVDLGTGTMAALAMASAWHAGQHGHIGLSMLDVAADWAAIKPEALTAVEPLYGTVFTRDREVFAVTALEDVVWHRMCPAFGWVDWTGSAEYDSPDKRRGAAGVIRARLDATVGALTAEELERIAATADLPFTRIDPSDAASREQLALRTAARPYGAHVPVPVAWPGIAQLTTHGGTRS